jgi:hypothetical protein
MEFGCMLPRSGGDKVDKSPTITPKFIRLKDPVSRCTWSIPILGRDSSLQL